MDHIISLLLLVFLYLVMNKFKFDPCLPEHLFRLCPVMVFTFAYHSFDPAIDDQHGTGPAGSHAAIKCRFFKRNPEPCRLTDGILLGMNGTHAMLRDPAIFVLHRFHQVADLIAVGQSARRTYITGDQDLLVARDHATASATVARSPLRDRMCDLHEILI